MVRRYNLPETKFDYLHGRERRILPETGECCPHVQQELTRTCIVENGLDLLDPCDNAMWACKLTHL